MALMDPYTGPWTEAEAGHLARRAGFGATPGEIAAMVSAGMVKVDVPRVGNEHASPCSSTSVGAQSGRRLHRSRRLPRICGWGRIRIPPGCRALTGRI